jgi:drug/metabolite transporter (DMT)-like permease
MCYAAPARSSATLGEQETPVAVPLSIRRPAVAPTYVPTLAVAVAIGSWGVGGVLVKALSVGGLTLAFFRLWLGAALMAGILAASGRRVTLGSVRAATPAGLIFGVNVALAFTSIRHTTVANATLISALQPALVLLVAGPLFGERVTRREVAWTGVAIAGIAVVIAGAEGSPEWSPSGDMLAFGALLTFTAYFLVSKHVRETSGTIELMAVVQLFAAIVVTPIALLAPGGVDLPSPVDWIIILSIVFGTGVGAHLVVNWAHRYVDVTVSSLLMLLVPVVAGVSAWLFLGEALSPLQMAGSAITLVALLAVVRSVRAPAIAAPEIAAGD